MKINYFDIHSHLESSKFDEDRETVISCMQDEGVFTITVGTDLESSKKVVWLASKHENIFASIGLHPTDSDEGFDEKDYTELVKNPKVVAVGECGLEFSKLGENFEQDIKSLETTEQDTKPLEIMGQDPKLLEMIGQGKQRQIDIFQKQIDFAVKYDKPLMIHCRDAHFETVEILEKNKKIHGEKLRGNIHFFSGDLELAKKYIDLRFMISFTGVITFAREYDEVIKKIPLEYIMAETDAPFVAPAPFRGQRCEPIYVKEVVKKISEIKNLPEEDVKNKLVENSVRFFSPNFS